MSVRHRLDDVWSRANQESKDFKDTQRGQEALARFLETLDGEDRSAAEDVLSEWIFSAEPRRQFDALATIERLELRSALPALRRFQSQLEDSSEPSAPYDWAWVNRIIGRLVATANPKRRDHE